MNVSLTPELENLITERVRSGAYGSASEVVRAALRLLARQDAEHDARLARLRGDLRVGVEQARRGEVSAVDFDAMLGRLESGETVP